MKSERSGTRQVVLIKVTKEVAVVQASGGVTVWDQPGACRWRGRWYRQVGWAPGATGTILAFTQEWEPEGLEWGRTELARAGQEVFLRFSCRRGRWRGSRMRRGVWGTCQPRGGIRRAVGAQVRRQPCLEEGAAAQRSERWPLNRARVYCRGSESSFQKEA